METGPTEAFQALGSISESAQVDLWETTDFSRRTVIERSLNPGTLILGTVSPATQADLAAVMAYTQQQSWRVLPYGSGSKLDWGGTVGKIEDDRPLLALSTERLNRLIDHAVGDLTVTVEAGMRFADLQTVLATAGQFLAIDPTYPEQATIGGIVATADTGSLRQRYNSVRDMLLGVSVVRADGQLAKAGGRVVKNVAGYDLMKLFTGSYGTLGVLTQVTFRVYPLPTASQSVVLSGAADAIAQATATIHASALTPVAMDVLSASVVEALELGKGMGLIIRFQSSLPSVREQVTRTIAVADTLGLAASVHTEDDAALWQQLREQLTPANRDAAITCKIGVSPSNAVTVLQQLDTVSTPGWFGQLHAATGLGRLVLPSTLLPDQLKKIRDRLQVDNGFLTILQAPAALKQQVDVWGYTGNALDLMRRLKHQFDPDDRLSPHRFVGGI